MPRRQQRAVQTTTRKMKGRTKLVLLFFLLLLLLLDVVQGVRRLRHATVQNFGAVSRLWIREKETSNLLLLLHPS